MPNQQRTYPSQEQNYQPRHADTPESSNANNSYKPQQFSYYPEQIIEDGLKACQRSILGKIITDKPIHVILGSFEQDIAAMALDVLNNNGDPNQLNSTHICLIPKIKNPSSPSDFRPISLCNVTLKIITKTLANRIKCILPEIISPNQSAFVQGRLITYNTLIASDIFHYLSHTKRKNGYVGIKTDMAKVYDRVEWDFLEATLTTMGFPNSMVQTIMKCVTTVNFSILINGHPSQTFHPHRGIRQGNPLSPYLFILCADVLSGLISKAQNSHLIHGVKIAHGAPEISHLLFADDSLIFCRATTEEVSTIHEVIQTYQSASGQLIKDHFSKYLGMPTVVGRSKNQVFNFIQEKIWTKLKGWKEKNLSFAGRSTLIKVVAQAIPTYLMSIFLIPKGWQKICKPKHQGGMGFRNLRAFNEALLAKQGWRLITHPSSMVAQVLKAKYYPNAQFLQAQPKQNMSYSWRSILQASWVLKKGCFWTIGS
ncbi:hypothetical protein A2U01_0005547, partial [Trifolium medium]|nr:hypothetical protein [Trifolium medium]